MRKSFWLSTAMFVALAANWNGDAQAQTLRETMAKAYSNSQSLNVARAQLRATDENVPQARAGMRPTIGASAGAQAVRSHTSRGDDLPFQEGRTESLSAGIEINQVIFDGFQTPNNVSSAQAQVRASQASLSNTVQNTLLDAVTAHMDVRRDRQIAEFRRQNLAFLREQVRAANARFEVGEGTRTDVAQAQSQEALATALLNSALAQVAVSESQYLDVVGDVPENLEPGIRPRDGLMPTSIAQALQISQNEHPAIQATLFAVEAASFQVKSAEGARLPQISVGASVDNVYSLNESNRSTGGFTDLPGVVDPNVTTQNQVSATVGAQISIPIYQGGLVSSQVRQAKEVLGQRRIEVDLTRDQVRALVASSFAQLQAAEANVTGYRAQVAAAQLALGGVSEERSVGQRTTLDVLNAQADVISAQVLLAGSQRDVIVAAYQLLSSVGRIDAEQLALGAEIYDPEEHYQAVQDKWHGMRTPDGR
jgi:outer membrane protein